MNTAPRYAVEKNLRITMNANLKSNGWRIRDTRTGHTLPGIYKRKADAQREADRLNQK